MSVFEDACDDIMEATVFLELAGPCGDNPEVVYKDLMKMVHPDKAPDEYIGEALYRAQPVYRDMDHYGSDPVRNIQGALDMDAVILSYGPKASDKKSLM